MATPTVFQYATVKNNPLLVSRSFDKNDEEHGDQISTMLHEVEDDLAQLTFIEEPETMSTQKDLLNLSRKLTLVEFFRYKKEDCLAMALLHRSDQILADEVLPVLAKDEAPSSDLKGLPKMALREMLVGLTDDFAKATGLAARPGPRLLAGLADLGPEDDLLLQEFCRLERKPNLAEMEMLADACRAPMQIVCTWFAIQCAQNAGSSLMKVRATKDSRLGTKLRKRENDRRKSSNKWPSVPAEFTDADINRAWKEAAPNLGEFEEFDIVPDFDDL